ncbi:putative ATP-binding protein [Trypanosoma conorhini]|uniref:Diphthine--ammonia ligase n=1 Tax=Trypanosoma conorhini TaxID=83891 RepID=A0A422PTQ8_9TRYP|nr:putative ATP-binding protein [Trypanosoma conorhini]RNF21155.1 putative ATP-binding protein [Trypanosoma conorhini]
MKTIALISGGKDSLLSVLLAMRYGHTPVVLANICPTCNEGPEHVHEIDSYSFQTVGHEAVESIAVCMELPLRRAYIRAGQSKVQGLHYTKERDEEDEVETLYRLLRTVKEEFPEVEGVTTGAILSHYQRYRVEDVCDRLGLHSLAFLWQRPAEEVLDIAAALQLHAILVKTASIGLDPRIHVGLSLEAVRPALEKAQRLYGTHSAGEGGEFETIVLDCPLFREQCLEIASLERVIVDDNDYSPSGYARLKVRRRNKTMEEKNSSKELLRRLPSLTFPSDSMRYLPHVDQFLKECAETLEWRTSPTPCSSDTEFWGCNCCDVYESDACQREDEMESCVTRVFRRIVEDMLGKKREAFFFLVLAPSLQSFEIVSEALARCFPYLQAPGCAFAEASELGRFRVEVLSSLREGIQRGTLQVGSSSCCGPVSVGSQSFANRVNLDAERRVIVSGCIGLVPVARRLAVSEDMPELLSMSLSRLSHSVGLEEGAVRAFIVQFAFTYANSVLGLTHFGGEATFATHATFFLSEMQFASLVPSLWRWCTGDATRLLPWGDPHVRGAAGGVVCRILHATQLPSSAAVELVLERREPLLEEAW